MDYLKELVRFFRRDKSPDDAAGLSRHIQPPRPWPLPPLSQRPPPSKVETHTLSLNEIPRQDHRTLVNGEWKLVWDCTPEELEQAKVELEKERGNW
jgi:hypothetical protein